MKRFEPQGFMPRGIKKAPDQNRTDTRSLEGYCSTVELQAHILKLCRPCLFQATKKVRMIDIFFAVL